MPSSRGFTTFEASHLASYLLPYRYLDCFFLYLNFYINQNNSSLATPLARVTIVGCHFSPKKSLSSFMSSDMEGEGERCPWEQLVQLLFSEANSRKELHLVFCSLFRITDLLATSSCVLQSFKLGVAVKWRKDEGLFQCVHYFWQHHQRMFWLWDTASNWTPAV